MTILEASTQLRHALAHGTNTDVRLAYAQYLWALRECSHPDAREIERSARRELLSLPYDRN